jgi:SAM-dependent methyltransferase
MPFIRSLHQAGVHRRRVSVLARHLSDLLPVGASVVDVGAGDGLLASRILSNRPDLQWTAIDTLDRPTAHMPVLIYDGETLPFDDRSFDVVLFVDVLHHTTDPMALLREAVRVTRSSLVIKDHLRDGICADTRLRFMDWVGNAGWGVQLPYNYWRQSQWDAAARELRLEAAATQGSLGLYPWWADWVFGGSLHFISRLDVRREVQSGNSRTLERHAAG